MYRPASLAEYWVTTHKAPLVPDTGSKWCCKLTGRPRQAVRVRPGVDDDQDAGEGGVVRRCRVAGLSAEQLHRNHAQGLFDKERKVSVDVAVLCCAVMDGT